MSDEMTLERFEELVAAYGAQVDNWPQEARTDMQHILENDARASAILARAARLDEALDDLLPDHMAVETRILQDMETFLDSDIIAFPQSQAMPRRALWSVATALAACFVGGIFAAPVLIDAVIGGGDLTASLDIISDVFLPTEPL